jgi:hypothetical protein
MAASLLQASHLLERAPAQPLCYAIQALWAIQRPQTSFKHKTLIADQLMSRFRAKQPEPAVRTYDTPTTQLYRKPHNRTDTYLMREPTEQSSYTQQTNTPHKACNHRACRTRTTRNQSKYSHLPVTQVMHGGGHTCQPTQQARSHNKPQLKEQSCNLDSKHSQNTLSLKPTC